MADWKDSQKDYGRYDWFGKRCTPVMNGLVVSQQVLEQNNSEIPKEKEQLETDSLFVGIIILLGSYGRD